MCNDKSPILPLRDLCQMCDGQPPEPKGDHSLISQNGSNYFLRIDPNTHTHTHIYIYNTMWVYMWVCVCIYIIHI